jgi:hypothetical protein
MIRNNVNIFNIESITDYLDFCRQTVAELAKDQANVVRGFSAVLALNHIPDWLKYKLSSSQRSMLGLSDVVGTPVKNHFEAMDNDLALIRSVANGFKHLQPMHSTTKRISGYGQGPFGVGPYGESYLLIDRGENCEPSGRWVVGLSLCKKSLDFWTQTLSPILEEKRND